MKQARDNNNCVKMFVKGATENNTAVCEVRKALARHLPYLKDDTSSQSFASRNII